MFRKNLINAAGVFVFECHGVDKTFRVRDTCFPQFFLEHFPAIHENGSGIRQVYEYNLPVPDAVEKMQNILNPCFVVEKERGNIADCAADCHLRDIMAMQFFNDAVIFLRRALPDDSVEFQVAVLIQQSASGRNSSLPRFRNA